MNKKHKMKSTQRYTKTELN